MSTLSFIAFEASSLHFCTSLGRIVFHILILTSSSLLLPSRPHLHLYPCTENLTLLVSTHTQLVSLSFPFVFSLFYMSWHPYVLTYNNQNPARYLHMALTELRVFSTQLHLDSTDGNFPCVFSRVRLKGVVESFQRITFDRGDLTP